MLDQAGGAVDNHQSGILARLGRMLRNQIVRKVEVKLGREHSCFSALVFGRS
jgi:hypothetical protein